MAGTNLTGNVFSVHLSVTRLLVGNRALALLLVIVPVIAVDKNNGEPEKIWDSFAGKVASRFGKKGTVDGDLKR